MKVVLVLGLIVAAILHLQTIEANEIQHTASYEESCKQGEPGDGQRHPRNAQVFSLPDAAVGHQDPEVVALSPYDVTPEELGRFTRGTGNAQDVVPQQRSGDPICNWFTSTDREDKLAPPSPPPTKQTRIEYGTLDRNTLPPSPSPPKPKPSGIQVTIYQSALSNSPDRDTSVAVPSKEPEAKVTQNSPSQSTRPGFETSAPVPITKSDVKDNTLPMFRSMIPDIDLISSPAPLKEPAIKKNKMSLFRSDIPDIDIPPPAPALKVRPSKDRSEIPPKVKVNILSPRGDIRRTNPAQDFEPTNLKTGKETSGSRSPGKETNRNRILDNPDNQRSNVDHGWSSSPNLPYNLPPPNPLYPPIPNYPLKPNLPPLPYGPPLPPIPPLPPLPNSPLPYGPSLPNSPLPYGPPLPNSPLPYGLPMPCGPFPQYGPSTPNEPPLPNRPSLPYGPRPPVNPYLTPTDNWPSLPPLPPSGGPRPPADCPPLISFLSAEWSSSNQGGPTSGGNPPSNYPQGWTPNVWPSNQGWPTSGNTESSSPYAGQGWTPNTWPASNQGWPTSANTESSWPYSGQGWTPNAWPASNQGWPTTGMPTSGWPSIGGWTPSTSYDCSKGRNSDVEEKNDDDKISDTE